jgi:hypothetical protein
MAATEAARRGEVGAGASALARTLYRSIAQLSKQHQRRRILVPTRAEPTADPTVYFLAPDFDSPAGGNRVIYRHVDILNDAGIKACVLHQKRGFRYSWFDNDTRVASVRDTAARRGDLLVIPEVDTDLLSRLASGIRFVVFNQNSFLTWQPASAETVNAYMGSPDLAGVLTVSQYNEEMLRLAFPGRAIRRVHLGIDPKVFRCGSEDRPRRIAYMPRRGRDHAQQVLDVLHGRGSLGAWEVVALDGLSHAEVADRLRTVRIFLAFTSQEGFGLPAAEAMACGSYVIGNHGYGGREFFLPEFSRSIETGDTVAFVHAVEEAINNDSAVQGWCSAKGEAASRFILDHYSPEREYEEVATFYAEALSSAVEQAPTPAHSRDRAPA